MNTRQEAALIVMALKKKKCKCAWYFISKNHDRYRMHGCHKPCKIRDELLARLNAA